ncbi:MAG: hypothetical protein NC388_05815 [Clostridium sp.]|nr:hypothetical protein [Clostridium sp.]
MKKKYLILTGLMCAWMGAQPVAAQTDVTAQYIKNPDFNVQSDWLTQNATVSPVVTGTVTDWTFASASTGWMAGGAFQYGTTVGQINGGSIPASGPDGNTDGGCLAMTASWANTVLYSQPVVLPAGYYQLSYIINNVGQNANFSESYFGFKSTGKNFYSTDASYPANTWTTSVVAFCLTEETNGSVDAGFKVANVGSGSTPKLIVDNVRLFQFGLNASPESPEDFTVWVGNDKASWTGASGTYGTYPERYTNGTPTGEYLSQTLTNLPLGLYDLVIECCPSSTSGRDGNVQAVEDGDSRYVTLSANDQAQNIPSYNRTSVATPKEDERYTFTDIKVTDGTLKIAATINEVGPNWFIIKAVSLKYKGADLSLFQEALAAAVASAKAVDQDKLNACLKNKLNETLARTENVEQTEEALKAATEALQAIVAEANGMTAVYPAVLNAIAACESVRDHSIASGKTAFSLAIEEAKTAVETAESTAAVISLAETLEGARQTYVLAAQPKDGFSFDLTFKIVNAAVASTSGWSSAKTSSGQQYDGAPDNTYLDIWNATINARQTVAGLPEGNYTLKAATRASTDVTTGNIYVESDGNTYRKDIHRVGSADNDLGNGWGWTVVDDIQVTAGSLTIGFYAECGSGRWAGADDFHLSYSGISNPYAVYDALREKANGLLASAMYSEYKAAIVRNVELTQEASRDELLQAILDLQTAVAHAEISVERYAYLQRELTTAKSFEINVQEEEAAVSAGTYDNDAAVEAARRLNVATYEKVQAGYGYEVPVDEWTGSIGAATGQHWSGDPDRTYYDTNGTDITASLTSGVTLPAGEYVLMAAGRSHANAKMELRIDDEKVTFTAKGDEGYGIETNGRANFSESGVYANDGKGRGWEWEFVHLQLSEEKNVTLTATITTSGWAWGSFSDISLKMDKATFEAVYYKKLQSALEACKPWTTGDLYAENTYPGYQQAYENKTYSTVAEIDAAVKTLWEAFGAYALENADIDHPYDVTDKIGYAECTAQDAVIWAGSGRETKTGQHWSGDANRVYFVQNHENGAARSQMITLDRPGAYLLKTSVRIVKENAYATISVDDVSETTTEVLGTTGGTIATDGTEWESVEAGIAAGKTFANGNKGYGWVYNDLYFGATSADDLKKTISINLSDWNSRNREADCGGMKLYYIGKNHVHAADGTIRYYGVFDEAPAVEVTDATPVADLTQAAMNNAQVARTNPNGLVYAKSGQVGAGENIVVDGVCASLRLEDKHTFVVPTGFTATHAVYTMSAVALTTAGEGFGTLCLPFEVTTLAGEAYKLDQGATVGGELYATEATAIPANTPVLVKAKGEYAGSNVEVSATQAGAAYEAGELVGVYSRTTAPVGSYVLQKHGDKVAFYLVGEEVQPAVNPFRAYIRPQAEAASLDVLSVVFGCGDETGIGAVETAEGVSEVSRHNAAGVQMARPQKGLNIVRMSDGSVRKVMVK